jgi:hypothetical protein
MLSTPLGHCWSFWEYCGLGAGSYFLRSTGEQWQRRQTSTPRSRAIRQVCRSDRPMSTAAYPTVGFCRTPTESTADASSRWAVDDQDHDPAHDCGRRSRSRTCRGTSRTGRLTSCSSPGEGGAVMRSQTFQRAALTAARGIAPGESPRDCRDTGDQIGPAQVVNL